MRAPPTARHPALRAMPAYKNLLIAAFEGELELVRGLPAARRIFFATVHKQPKATFRAVQPAARCTGYRLRRTSATVLGDRGAVRTVEP